MADRSGNLGGMNQTTAERVRTVIVGAAGRDFHNFNVVYRADAATEVVAFTAAQIQGIAGRVYPPVLAGELYPDGIPILDESGLDELLRDRRVQRVVFAYSDVPNTHLMQVASRVLAAGADFLLLGPLRTMLPAPVPVIAVSAVRTGCGKSQTVRYLVGRLRRRGLRIGVIRHPMPYGILERQAVQRFETLADLSEQDCTIEEREEYEPHIRSGSTVHVGIDTARVVAQASRCADLILWDGGNNDFPMVRPDLQIVLVDALRGGHETEYYPGQAVLRSADVVVVTKTDSATPAQVQRALDSARQICPNARLLRATSPVQLDDPDAVTGKRVLVVEDGPTLTHGGMPWGAGYVAARAAGAAQIVDPRTSATPDIARVFLDYPHIGPVLPAMGYSHAQREALKQTIEQSVADVVVTGTPIDLKALLDIRRVFVRARYDFAEADVPGLWDEVESFAKNLPNA